MAIFEVIMLVCFGVGWPVSIAKSLRTKVVVGKSPLFMAIICLGYASGICFKLTGKMDWVVSLYIANLVMVAADLALYYRYLPRPAPAEAGPG